MLANGVASACLKVYSEGLPPVNSLDKETSPQSTDLGNAYRSLYDTVIV